jgi:Tyrosine phosphatase family
MKSLFCLLSLSLALCGCKFAPSSNGVPNFAVIDPTTRVYRGAEPLPAGWQYLASHGVSNVVKLNTEAEGTDAPATALGMKVNHFPFTSEEQLSGPLDDAKVKAAVAAITAGTFIHCGSDSRSDTNSLAYRFHIQGGQDRTGLICALYRLKTGWTKQAAEDEMLKMGFHKFLHGLHEYWENASP